MVSTLFRSKARKEIIRLVLLYPNKSFYIREISRLCKIPASNITTEIKKLEKDGLIKSSTLGPLKMVSVNKKWVFFKEFKSIFEKTMNLKKI